MPRLSKPLLFASPAECEQAFYDALEAADAEAKPQPRERAWRNQRGKKTLLSLTLV